MATNLWLPFQVQLDASGNGTAEVGAPALGFNWQAFVTFGTAPSGQSFTVSVLGQVVASGGRQSGPFAAGSGNTVTVTVSGGPASSTVNGVVQGAINQGVAAQAPLPSSGSLIEIAAGTIDATITGPVDANITNATLPVSGTIDLAPGTTVDASITNASLAINGPVTIQQGQGGTNVLTELPDDFTFGSYTATFDGILTATGGVVDILSMTNPSVYSLLYVVFSIFNQGGSVFALQAVSSSGGTYQLVKFASSTPLQGIIIPMFMVSSPASGVTWTLQWVCITYSQNVEISGSLIYRLGAPSNVTPWLT